MAYSQVVSYIDNNSEIYVPRQVAVSRVTIHCGEGNFTLNDYSRMVRNNILRSWNYAIDSNGNIGVYINEEYQANGTGDDYNDSRAINILLSTNNSREPWTVSDKTIESVMVLCEDIARRQFIKSYKFDRPDNSNVTLHKWYEDTQCPYSYIESKLPNIVRIVNSRLKSKNPSKELQNHIVFYPQILSTTATAIAESGDSLYSPKSSKSQFAWDNIDTKALTPFIITLTRDSDYPPYSTLINYGLSGVLIEAGYLYSNPNHILQTDFANPNLGLQIQEAKQSKLLTSFFFYGRAKNINQIKLEIESLQKTLRHRSADFGIWLRPQLYSDSIKTNDDLIDNYAQELSNIGYAGNIGLYANRNELSKITWSKHQNNWLLWLDDHVKDKQQLTKAQNNIFFKV